MPIQVYSEIAPLRRVLLHRPGQELEHLVPGSLERLLFDDIPYLKGAQAEHDRFAQVLRDNGVEVVYLSKLTAEALSQDKALKEAFIRDFTQKSGSVAHRYERELQAYLGSIEDVHEMVLQTMAGIPFSDLALDHAESLTAMLHCKADFALEPIPNLYFTRDPFASVGGGVALHRMYSATRRRETLYGAYILQHHPEYAGTPFYYTPDSPYSLEGGDVMMCGDTFYVGLSGRTNPEGVKQLANILEPFGCKVVGVPLTEVLHLKTGVVYLENGVMLTAGEFCTKSAFEGYTKITVPKDEPYAANCIWVNGKVIVPEGYPKVLKAVQAAGYQTLTCDTSEYKKIDGGLSCLSLRF